MANAEDFTEDPFSNLVIEPLVTEELICRTEHSDVFRASSPSSELPLAVKVAVATPVARLFLSREAEITSQVDSSRVLPVLSSGTIRQPGSRWNGRSYNVYPFNELTLNRIKVDDLESAGVVLGFIKDLAEGIRDIHAKGMVHGDFKDENAYVSPNGQVFISDVGLAVDVGERITTHINRLAEDFDLGPLNGAEKERTTVSTPGYSSLNQMQDGPMTERDDIFSFGVTAHKVLTGKYPWKKFNDGGLEKLRADHNYLKIAKIILKGNLETDIPDYIPQSIVEFFQACVRPSDNTVQDLSEVTSLRLTDEPPLISAKWGRLALAPPDQNPTVEVPLAMAA